MTKWFFICIFTFQALSGSTHYVLMGAPGSGKGTLTAFLKEKGNYKHLCAGDLLRTAIEEETPIGQIFRQYVEAGELVPTDLFFPFFEENFTQALDSGQRLIVDGIVQSQVNIEFIEDLFVRYNVDEEFGYLYLNVDKEVALDRLLGRLVCMDCKAICSKNICETQCELCGGVLVSRLDDTNATIMKRIDRFFNSTIRLVEHFRNKPSFHEFDANLDRNQLFSDYQVFFQDSD